MSGRSAVKWYKDLTGRFPERPHIEAAQLDSVCEQFVTAFLIARHGKAHYPISTDDLTVLIERETEEFDRYADLSTEGPGVQGVTEFNVKGKPTVRISAELSAQSHRENRLRTTLTHELGHVHFHNFLFAFNPKTLTMTRKALREASPRCRRESIVSAASTDWMEWQAAYACGAFLMPASAVKELVLEYREAQSEFRPIFAASDSGRQLIANVEALFQVSAQAATVRLSELGYTLKGEPVPSLFDSTP